MLATQSYTYKIHSYHTDARGKLFIHQLLNFFQDAAHQHADGLGFGQAQLSEINLFWVLSRLTIEITELPQQGDEIELSTWVKSIGGSISEREFSICINGNVLVNASSLWFCISGKSHKPVKVPNEYVAKMLVNDFSATDSGPIKIEKPKTELSLSLGKIVSAQYTDIDMADHVNNATYVRWIFDELPLSHQQKRVLRQLTVNYLAEVFLDSELEVTHSTINKDQQVHQIKSTASKNSICLAETLWL